MNHTFLKTVLLFITLILFRFVPAQAVGPERPELGYPDGGCHYIVDIDPTTGERIVTPASQRRRGHYASTSDGLGAYNTSGVGPVPTIGDITIPVIMVDFSDQGFLPTTTEAAVEQWFNGENYSGYGNTGSVRDYFLTQSGGMFRPYFKVMGTVHTNKPVATYGAGGSNQENVEGLSHAVTGNFSYSGMTRQSGAVSYVPLCIIYYAGGGQHRTGIDSQIWAKFTEYSYYDFAGLFKQYFKSYLYINEARGNEMDGVGTACHELSHALGLPDVYDTSGNGSRTPGLWSLMASGNYAGNSCSPVDMCALERSQCGWLRIQELNSAGSYTLAPTEAALIRNSSNNKEYYIMENRTNTRWTPPGMAGGMLVYHIDYDKSAWESSHVNVDNNHLRMMFVAADREPGDAYESDYHNDLYPYKTNDSLTVNSLPAMTAFTGNFNGKPVYNIRRDGLNITFDYIIKTEVPTVTPPSEINVTETFNTRRRVATTATPLSEVRDDELYALYNPHFTTYAIYRPSQSKTYVWSAGTTGDSSHSVSKQSYRTAFDATSNFSAWRVKGGNNRYLFQNEGSGLYLTTPMSSGSNPCEWTTATTFMMTTQREDGLFAMSSSGSGLDYFCVAPQLTTSPLSVWTSTDDGAGWELRRIYETDEPDPITPEPEPEIEYSYTMGQPATSVADLTDGIYALYNPHYTTYAIMNRQKSSSFLWAAGMTGDSQRPLTNTAFSQPYDITNSENRWKLTRLDNGQFYLQDQKEKKYLEIPYLASGGTACVDTWPSTVTIRQNTDGTFSISSNEREIDYLCAQPNSPYPIRGWQAADDGAKWQLIHLIQGDPIDPTDPTDPKPSVSAAHFPISFADDAVGENSERSLLYVSLQEEGKTEQQATALSATRVYQDMTSQSFSVQPGSTFVPRIGYNGSWMHGYFYIDKGNDGTLSWNSGTINQTGADLCSFTFWSTNSNAATGYNSLGTLISGNNRNSVVNNVITLPSVTAPTTPGTYYMRYKVDWNSLDPAGSAESNNDIVHNSGFIVDICLQVESTPASTLGDVNGDGDINVGDLTALVSFILGTQNSNYSQIAADMNADGTVNVTDYTLLVSRILNTSSTSGAPSLSSRPQTLHQHSSTLIYSDSPLRR